MCLQAQAGNTPLKGESKPPVQLVVLIVMVAKRGEQMAIIEHAGYYEEPLFGVVVKTEAIAPVISGTAEGAPVDDVPPLGEV